MSFKISDVDSNLATNVSVIGFPDITYQGPVGDTQTFYLEKGWQLLSFFLKASSFVETYPNMLSFISAINTMLNPNGGIDYTDNNPDAPYIVVAKSNAGSATLPQYSFDGVGSFTDGQGYQVKLVCNSSFSGVIEFSVSGDRLEYDDLGVSQSVSVDLASGWNTIAMPLSIAVDLSVVFSTLVNENKIIIVKDYNGSAYLPEYYFNGIGDMIPGRGYQVKTNGACTLVFDRPTQGGINAETRISPPARPIQILAPPVNIPEETESIFNIYINPDILRTFFNSFGIDIQIQEIQQNILNEYLEVILSEPELYIIYKKQGAGGIFEYLPILIANEDLFSQYPWYARDAINLMYTAYKNILYGKEFINFKKDALIIERPFLLEVRDSSNNVIGYSDIIQRQTGPLPEFQDYLDVAIPVGFTSATTCSFFLYDEFAQQHFPLKTDPVAITSEVNGIFILNSLSLQNGVEYKKD